jgi:cell division protein FtsB
LNKAVVADERNIKKLSHQNKVLEHKVKKAKEQADSVAQPNSSKKKLSSPKSLPKAKNFSVQ